MNDDASKPDIPALRRLLRFMATAAIVLAVLVAVLAWLMQPPRATGFLLARIGDALGLRIVANGAVDYRLRGTPQLLLHDVVAQRPGDATPRYDGQGLAGEEQRFVADVDRAVMFGINDGGHVQ